ncbi:MAG: flagellar hook-basal body complex protein FliE, partial [Litoricolaceae bacterium]|nr:flagellar hook-basal body complex protein FliE [Litorivicinaceae bacterium]
YQTRVNETHQPETAIPSTEVEKPKFNEAVRALVNSVNDAQMQSADMRAAFERGEDVPLTDVVLSMQKSSLAFEATLQVRNKVLKAYEDIMNMPV